MTRSHTQPVEDFTFENLDRADRIVVTNNLNEKIEDVDDPAVIRAVLSFVKSHKTGWTVPPFGVPVARLRLNFYAADRPLGNVGVGKTFLTAHQFGSFWSKTSDEGEHSKLLDIIGLKDYEAAG
jgi:hypothetical protein